MNSKPRVAVIGGGIAGLTAAWQLVQSAPAADVVLFEASARLGGIVETVREQGFTIECGPDSWVTEKPWAKQLAEELGLGGELLPSNDATRKTYILKAGTLAAMPDGMRLMVPGDLQAVADSLLFSEGAKQSFHREPARAAELRASAPDEDESVASFVRRHFGDEVLQTIGDPLLSGVFGGDVATLSVRAVMAPFVAMERQHGSLIHAVQVAQSLGRPSAPVFTTLRGGLGTLTDVLAAHLPRDAVRLNTPITSLTRHRMGWTVGTMAGGQEFNYVLLATPADIASSLLRATDTRAAELMQVEASSAVIVAFGFTDPFELPPGFGFLVPQADSSVDALLAATFADQKFDTRAPAGGRLIRAFFGGTSGKRLLDASDATILTLAMRELTSILGALPAPKVTVVRRWPRSLPQYAVGHLARMAELETRVQRIGALLLLGNGYRGVGLPDLIRDARAAGVACTGLLSES